MSHLDELDKKILRIIKLDGRARVSEIAERVGSTSPTVSRKIKLMEEANIIKGYVGIVEDYDLGVNVDPSASRHSAESVT